MSEICDITVVNPIPYAPAWLKIDKYIKFCKVPLSSIKGKVSILHPRYLVIPKFGRSFYGLFYFASIFFSMRRIKRDYKPDIMIAYWAYPDGFAATLISKILKIPVILSCRGCDINDIDKTIIIKSLVKWALGSCNKIFAVSSAMKEKIISLGIASERVVIIPNGIDTLFAPIEKELAIKEAGIKRSDEKVILFCGRMSAEKGIEYLIDACRILMIDGIRFNLALVGSGSLKGNIIAKVKEMGLSDYVTFYDEVPHDKVRYFMSGSDMLCLPSLREGWPNVVVEAMACGIPVVASKVGGVPEIITDSEYGIMFPPGDVQALASALKTAINKKWDSDLIRSAVKNRTWHKVAEDVLKEATSLLQGSK